MPSGHSIGLLLCGMLMRLLTMMNTEASASGTKKVDTVLNYIAGVAMVLFGVYYAFESAKELSKPPAEQDGQAEVVEVRVHPSASGFAYTTDIALEDARDEFGEEEGSPEGEGSPRWKPKPGDERRRIVGQPSFVRVPCDDGGSSESLQDSLLESGTHASAGESRSPTEAGSFREWERRSEAGEGDAQMHLEEGAGVHKAPSARQKRKKKRKGFVPLVSSGSPVFPSVSASSSSSPGPALNVSNLTPTTIEPIGKEGEGMDAESFSNSPAEGRGGGEDSSLPPSPVGGREGLTHDGAKGKPHNSKVVPLGARWEGGEGSDPDVASWAAFGTQERRRFESASSPSETPVGSRDRLRQSNGASPESAVSPAVDVRLQTFGAEFGGGGVWKGFTSPTMVGALDEGGVGVSGRAGEHEPGKKRFCCGCTVQTAASLACGVLHGVAGPGGILGLLPASRYKSIVDSVVYLFVFLAVTTLTMGMLAAGWGEFTYRVSAPSRAVLIGVHIFSCLASIGVGVLWIVLTAMGILDEVFD
uniref:Phosphatidic acid phosphatase type 2/haloperoxidase domain-containing protein n=1 Tax=Chromera velia CCMP2878 TaxID=1169474 RepID=A0A0G4FT78_9ALVE|eukprot:Cvel_18560.t1-p1 / transcript=Cvel_18560.t1 / gene=Cvel_18560 / organism=Chromera_velia_CCMP2878 / gene_product=hypothetical protein / transcript_product=hypothetical protein / location=Cvel_scaffold1546:13745-18610(+) / protein_length=529 / sequence_SO=supercontig / SO=protein_coding / is_pseudo=false